MSLKLYVFPPSPRAFKVLLAAHQLGIDYELKLVDLTKGEQKAPSFVALNPNGRVPMLEFEDGRFLPESGAIVSYLAEGSKLIPDGRWDRAQMLQWMFFEQYSHEPYVATPRYIVRHFPAGSPRHAELPARLVKGHAALAVMEQHLQKHDFFVGGRYGLADVRDGRATYGRRGRRRRRRTAAR